MSGDDFAKMPLSRPWNAPEWHDRAFKASDMIKMDVYSFGMLCLWFLFQENEQYPGQNAIRGLKSNDTLRVLAQQLIVTTVGLDNEQKSNLESFFNLTLVRDPKRRDMGFEQLSHLLIPDR
jgi:hypothetical protein